MRHLTLSNQCILVGGFVFIVLCPAVHQIVASVESFIDFHIDTAHLLTVRRSFTVGYKAVATSRFSIQSQDGLDSCTQFSTNPLRRRTRFVVSYQEHVQYPSKCRRRSIALEGSTSLLLSITNGVFCRIPMFAAKRGFLSGSCASFRYG